MIIKQITVGKFEVFCYVLGCEETRKGVVIDPGGGVKSILEIIEEQGLTIEYIINTHFHSDHTMGNSALKKATGATVVMHEADNAMVNDQEAIDYFSREGLPSSLPAEKTVRDGDILQMGNYRLEVIHTPGHSPGSICLLSAGNLFTGDALFVGAAGRVDVPGGDFTTQITALEEKIATLPPDTVIWPGHNYGDTPTSTIGRERKENPFLGGEW